MGWSSTELRQSTGLPRDHEQENAALSYHFLCNALLKVPEKMLFIRIKDLINQNTHMLLFIKTKRYLKFCIMLRECEHSDKKNGKQ